MKIEKSYFVALANGTKAWLAVGKPAPSDAFVLEERLMIIPDEGMVLRHKVTDEESTGHWLRDGRADDWEEIDEPKEEQGAE